MLQHFAMPSSLAMVWAPGLLNLTMNIAHSVTLWMGHWEWGRMGHGGMEVVAETVKQLVRGY